MTNWRETREASVEHLDSRLKAWANQLKTELSLYEDGGYVWNRIKFDMFSSVQKKTLSPEIQELFRQQKDIEVAYYSIDAAEQYRKRLRSIPNLSDEFVQKVLLQRGHKKPPKRRQGLGPLEEANRPQEMVSSAKRAKRVPKVKAKPPSRMSVRKKSWRIVLLNDLERQLAEAISSINSQLARSVDGPEVWNRLVRTRFCPPPSQLASMTLQLQAGFKWLHQVRKQYEALGLRSAYEAKLPRLMMRDTKPVVSNRKLNQANAVQRKTISKGIEGYFSGKDIAKKRYYWNEED